MERRSAGGTYYIDPAAGEDTNDGRSPSSPFRTDRARDFGGGDAVLFRRGGVVRDVLHARDGTEGAPITYGAYGEGERPAFLGSVAVGNPDHWIEERSSVWRYTGDLPTEVCNLIFDGGACCGILRWRPDELRQPGDWHFTSIGSSSGVESWGDRNREDGVLYLCSPKNPGLAYQDVECALWGQRRLVGGRRHIVIENLSFRNAGVHGYQESHAQSVVIRDCEFRFIGGAVWHRAHRIRFGNGVEFWDGASDVTVERCLFDNIYDSAVTHQGGGTRNIPERIRFRDNLFIDCGLSAYESREPARDVTFEHNTCINSGGGFAAQGERPPRRTDPYPQPVGYHVFIFLIDADTQPGPVSIRHNVFCRSSGAAISAIIEPADMRRFAIDENSYWQSTDGLLYQSSRLVGGKSWSEAMAFLVSTGELSSLLGGSRTFGPSRFGRYQEETGQDRHSRVAEPLFMDPALGDYLQRSDSPCAGLGMRGDVRVPPHARAGLNSTCR
jgi:predicted outer membrane repeat protein